ncbi:replicative DNA helicase [Actinopolymorpha pittospori]|uniref:Replicative DNA helicase n=1 Tax=Actinopolymorpha pittospori TaxID=648752 RepID=A0A927MQ45_9ACTN|nr:replicative DNA helicase [Actinopolymorpha pittospori]
MVILPRRVTITTLTKVSMRRTLSVAKSRSGPSGAVAVAAALHRSTFRNVARRGVATTGRGGYPA